MIEIEEKYQTPPNICDYMVSMIPENTVTILEPTRGIGNIVNSLKRAKKFNITSADDFFKLDKTKRYDCIVMNPPFSSKYAFGVPEEIKDSGMKLGYYILTECMKMSNNIIALMPWFTISDSDVRLRYLKGYGIKSLTTLPRKTFNYARIQTVIIELEKGYSKETIFPNITIIKAMGYKNVKKHYDIKHIVAVHDKSEFGGPCICIGSPYIHDIIVVRIQDAKVVKQYKNGKYNDGWSTNEELAQYNEALKADEQNGVLLKLIETPDTFAEELPVFTIEKGVVVREVCEKYGWPNTTNSGGIMYENTYFKTRKEAYAYLLSSTSSGVRYCNFKSNIKEAFERIIRTSKYGFLQLFYWVKARTVGRFYTKSYEKKDYKEA